LGKGHVPNKEDKAEGVHKELFIANEHEPSFFPPIFNENIPY
jgi:hypothetical protein